MWSNALAFEQINIINSSKFMGKMLRLEGSLCSHHTLSSPHLSGFQREKRRTPAMANFSSFSHVLLAGLNHARCKSSSHFSTKRPRKCVENFCVCSAVTLTSSGFFACHHLSYTVQRVKDEGKKSLKIVFFCSASNTTNRPVHGDIVAFLFLSIFTERIVRWGRAECAEGGM